MLRQSVLSCQPLPRMICIRTLARSSGIVYSPLMVEVIFSAARLGLTSAWGRWGEIGGLVACIPPTLFQPPAAAPLPLTPLLPPMPLPVP